MRMCLLSNSHRSTTSSGDHPRMGRSISCFNNNLEFSLPFLKAAVPGGRQILCIAHTWILLTCPLYKKVNKYLFNIDYLVQSGVPRSVRSGSHASLLHDKNAFTQRW